MFPVFFAIFILTSSGIVLTAPITIPQGQESGLLSYENVNDGRGEYKFSFETIDHIKREETGTLIGAGQPDEYILVSGYYSYVRPDGQIEKVRYSADKDGYRILPPVDISYPPSEDVLPPSVVATLLGK